MASRLGLGCEPMVRVDGCAAGPGDRRQQTESEASDLLSIPPCDHETAALTVRTKRLEGSDTAEPGRVSHSSPRHGDLGRAIGRG
jgi:hypothetical protein